MDKAEQQDLTGLSVKTSKQLEQELRKLARLGRRSFREAVVYFLEVMLALCVQRPSFRLEPSAEDETDCMSGQIKLPVSRELYDRLFHKAGEYGLKVPELVRLLLRMALSFHQKFVPGNQVVRKEDFLAVILESLDERTRLIQ